MKGAFHYAKPTDHRSVGIYTRGKWNYIFRLNRANQEEWLLLLFIHFANSLIRAKNGFVKNGTANFGQNIPTEISGPPPEVIPNIPVGRTRNGPKFRNSEFRPKFPESLA